MHINYSIVPISPKEMYKGSENVCRTPVQYAWDVS